MCPNKSSAIKSITYSLLSTTEQGDNELGIVRPTSHGSDHRSNGSTERWDRRMDTIALSPGFAMLCGRLKSVQGRKRRGRQTTSILSRNFGPHPVKVMLFSTSKFKLAFPSRK